MRIYTRAGNLPFQTFTFSDGQPHFKLQARDEWGNCTIESAITSFNDLALILLANDTLRRVGYMVDLDIRYLLGARMDRAISAMEPFTLDIVAKMINSGGFRRVRMLDAHSSVATSLIANAVNLLPFEAVKMAYVGSGAEHIIIPDKGAGPRIGHLDSRINFKGLLIQCEKTREISTGKLTGFSCDRLSFVKDQPLLIIDDICDGGGHLYWARADAA